MVLPRVRYLLTAALLVAAGHLALESPQAQAQAPHPSTPPLFVNYYGPAGPSGIPAQMYVSPRPAPAYVGHTWVTYEPLMPDEFLWQHHRTYVTPHGWGRTKTRVSWGAAREATWLKNFFIGRGPVEFCLGLNNFDFLTNDHD